MKKHYVLWGIVVVCVLINAFIFLYPAQNNSLKRETFYRIENQMAILKHKSEHMLLSVPFYYGTDSTRLYTFADNFKDQVLVFYFSIEACSPCLEAIVESIQKIFPDYSKEENIVFLSDDLEWRFRNQYWNKKIINLKGENPIPFIKGKVPTLFLINPQTSTIHNVFPYNKETPNYLDDYLRIIKERFFLP